MRNNRGSSGQRGGGQRVGARDEGAITGRGLKTRVKTAHKRSLSSTLWLDRQLNDPYVAEAKKRGYRSRAAFNAPAFEVVADDEPGGLELVIAPAPICG